MCKRELNVPIKLLAIAHSATVRREIKMRLLEYMDQYFQLETRCSMLIANSFLKISVRQQVVLWGSNTTVSGLVYRQQHCSKLVVLCGSISDSEWFFFHKFLFSCCFVEQYK